MGVCSETCQFLSTLRAAKLSATFEWPDLQRRRLAVVGRVRFFGAIAAPSLTEES
jgi:hypothetical protein